MEKLTLVSTFVSSTPSWNPELTRWQVAMDTPCCPVEDGHPPCEAGSPPASSPIHPGNGSLEALHLLHAPQRMGHTTVAMSSMRTLPPHSFPGQGMASLPPDSGGELLSHSMSAEISRPDVV